MDRATATAAPPSPATPSTLRRLLRDPRHYQLAVLGTLFVYGLVALDFSVRPATALLLVATALAVQAVCSKVVGLPRFDPKSPLISALSLCLLLRTASPLLAAVTAAVTIASKFTLRRGGKHLFNPTNFGLVAMMTATGGAVWVSPGQWGSAAFLAALAACLGILVVHRAERSDVTWAFLAAWTAIVFGRALYLGDPLAIPLHQLQRGSLLIFAFFMISDPKTTPNRRAGRVLFAVLVAAGGALVEFGLYHPNGALYALVAGALTVPLIDRLLPGERYRWPGARQQPARMAGARSTPAAARGAAVGAAAGPALAPPLAAQPDFSSARSATFTLERSPR